MAITLNYYVDITSGVGAGASVDKRDLILRLFTTNPLVPTGSFVEMDSSDEALSFFGSTSEEYLRAKEYFGWISKKISRPKKISFARWADVDTAPLIYGVADDFLLATFTAITNGTLMLTLGAVQNEITAIDLSAATSLTDVADAIQTKIRAETGTMWTAANVVYDPIRKSFNFTGGEVGAAVVALESTPLATALGWTVSATFSDGVAAETVDETLAASFDASTNFGGFVFTDTAALTNAQIYSAATWNKAKNNMFLFSASSTYTNGVTLYDLVGGVGGTSIEEFKTAEYHDQLPATILASINFNDTDAVVNFMFHQFPNASATASTNAEAKARDAIRMNYIAQTQTAGQKIELYQRGIMCGGSADPYQMGVYVNEMWLKDQIATDILELQLDLTEIGANDKGLIQLQAIIQQGAVTKALSNGVISIRANSNPFSVSDKLYIKEETDDALAYIQIQNIGYWLDINFESFVGDGGGTEWKAVYKLIYAKNDTISKVEGTHTLI